MMEELDVEKTGEPKMWLRRVLVFVVAAVFAAGIGGVLSIWMVGRAILFLAAVAVFAVFSILGFALSAALGALAGGALSDWADLSELWLGVFAFLCFVAYTVAYVILVIFGIPVFCEVLYSWMLAGAH